MESIGLYTEQHNKLQEVLDTLFPEYYFGISSVADQWFIGAMDMKSPCREELFYWYEFCLTHLMEKLYDYSVAPGFMEETTLNKYRNSWLDEALANKQHIVDVLYSEFKDQ